MDLLSYSDLWGSNLCKILFFFFGKLLTFSSLPFPPTPSLPSPFHPILYHPQPCPTLPTQPQPNLYPASTLTLTSLNPHHPHHHTLIVLSYLHSLGHLTPPVLLSTPRDAHFIPWPLVPSISQSFFPIPCCSILILFLLHWPNYSLSLCLHSLTC